MLVRNLAGSEELDEELRLANRIEWVHKRLLTIGRKCYEEHLRGEYPDHTYSPEAFAYAIVNGEFTPREKKRIRFDHGETEDVFVRLYGGDIGAATQLSSQKREYVDRLGRMVLAAEGLEAMRRGFRKSLARTDY